MTTTVENRESFFARISPFMAPSELRNVEVAYMMAKFGHRAQIRKELDVNGNPVRYFEHVRRVALILLDELLIRDPEMICAALLHDCLEDTKDVTEEIIEHVFGREVIRMVKLLSKLPPKEDYYGRLTFFGDPKIWIIKGCDRLDNLRSLDQCTKAFQEKQLTETRKVIYPMLWKLVNTTQMTNVYAQYLSAAYAIKSMVMDAVDELTLEFASQEDIKHPMEIIRGC